jgi:hypothetical protein
MDCLAARMNAATVRVWAQATLLDSFQPASLFSTLQVQLAPHQSLAANTPPALASLIFTPRRRPSR